MATPELKRCPFCGTPAEIDTWDQTDADDCIIGYGMSVGCPAPEDICLAQPAVRGDAADYDKMIDAWNKRAPCPTAP